MDIINLKNKLKDDFAKKPGYMPLSKYDNLLFLQYLFEQFEQYKEKNKMYLKTKDEEKRGNIDVFFNLYNVEFTYNYANIVFSEEFDIEDFFGFVISYKEKYMHYDEFISSIVYTYFLEYCAKHGCVLTSENNDYKYESKISRVILEFQLQIAQEFMSDDSDLDNFGIYKQECIMNNFMYLLTVLEDSCDPEALYKLRDETLIGLIYCNCMCDVMEELFGNTRDVDSMSLLKKLDMIGTREYIFNDRIKCEGGKVKYEGKVISNQ